MREIKEKEKTSPFARRLLKKHREFAESWERKKRLKKREKKWIKKVKTD